MSKHLNLIFTQVPQQHFVKHHAGKQPQKLAANFGIGYRALVLEFNLDLHTKEHAKSRSAMQANAWAQHLEQSMSNADKANSYQGFQISANF